MDTPMAFRKPATPICYGIEIEGNSKYIHDKHLHGYLSFFYVTRDASLNRLYDLELVSQPLPFKMLVAQLNKLSLRGYIIDPTANAGIHIHVTRTTEIEKICQQIAINLYFIPIALVQRFFGRTPNDYCSIPAPYRIGTDRYQMINFTRANTIEFRGFSHTINSAIGSGDFKWAITCLNRTKALLKFNKKKHDLFYFMRDIIDKYPTGD